MHYNSPLIAGCTFYFQVENAIPFRSSGVLAVGYSLFVGIAYILCMYQHMSAHWTLLSLYLRSHILIPYSFRTPPSWSSLLQFTICHNLLHLHKNIFLFYVWGVTFQLLLIQFFQSSHFSFTYVLHFICSLYTELGLEMLGTELVVRKYTHLGNIHNLLFWLSTNLKFSTSQSRASIPWFCLCPGDNKMFLDKYEDDRII